MQVAEQLKTISNGEALQGKVDRLKAELEAFVKEKSAWTKEKKRVSKSNLSLEKKLDRQMTAKHAHQQKMAEIALERKRVGLEESKQRQVNADNKQKTITEGKKELVGFNHKKRDKSKIPDLKRKEDALPLDNQGRLVRRIGSHYHFSDSEVVFGERRRSI
jgi:hypothetical protein